MKTKPNVTARSLALALMAALNPLTIADTGAQEPRWSYSVVPYIWALGFDGKARIAGLPEVELGSSFREILERLDVGGMVVFEGRQGRYGFLADVQYSRVSDSGVVPPGVPAQGRVTSTTLLLAGQARLHRDDRTTLDGLVGFRYWSVDARADVRTPPPGLSRSAGTRWLDPQVGVKAVSRFGPKWHGHGVFLLAPNETPSIDLTATLAYGVDRRGAVHFGYRYLTARRLGASSGVDAVYHGPLLGFAIRF